MESTPANPKIDVIGRYAGILSLIEVSLGSLLHAFRVPLTGNFLSLNQGYLLCRASLAAKRQGLPGEPAHLISNAAAVLKSLAPAGKKLGPMLSLSMQGFLFTIGTKVFGTNLVGLAMGMMLLSLWTFIQPLLTYYLFFGDQLFSAFDYFQKNVPFVRTSGLVLISLFALVVVTKVAIAISLAFIAWKNQGAGLYQDKLLDQARARGMAAVTTHKSPLKAACKDLLNPIFLASFAMTSAFLYFVENSWSEFIWLSLRPIAIAFIFFYISRKINLRKILRRTKNSELAQVTERALQEIESKN